MSFLYPLFLAGLAAVAIPILLHLFRRRTEVVVDFPAVRFLHKGPVEQQRRRRLRELILLALRVTALALLAFAFARPYLPTAMASAPVPVTVITLDTSLSMSAPGQWERAQQAARQAVQNASATHHVAFVSFADAATLVVPATTDRGGVNAAIDQARPGSGGTRYRTALVRASEAIASGQGKIVVITDLQQAGWDANDEGAVPDGIEVEIVEVASSGSNLAVTTARREGAAIVAGIHNFGVRAVRAPVRLRVGERDLATQTVEIAPQSAADVRFDTRLPERGGAEVHVEDREGFAGDNARYLVLDPPAPLPVLIITAEPPDSSNAGLYVERALGVADDGRAFAARVVDGRALSAMPDEQFRPVAAVVLLGTGTLDRAGRERVVNYLKGGGGVLLTLGPDVDLATLADTVGIEVRLAPESTATAQTVALVAADTRHPIFRPFSSPSGALGDVYVEQFRRLDAAQSTPVTVLARFSGTGDALIEQRVEKGRLLVFASDLDNRWNRFPLNPAFVPWAIETVRYLAQGREQRRNFTLPQVPAGLPARAGVHMLGDSVLAINADITESNPARTSPDDFLAAVTRSTEVVATRAAAAAREQEEKQRLWQIGLLVMFVALASEGLIGRRAI